VHVPTPCDAVLGTVSIVLRSIDSISQTAGFISGCFGSRRRSPDEIQQDTNITLVDKAVENPVDMMWGTGINPV
jgi:hypothetical protein